MTNSKIGKGEPIIHNDILYANYIKPIIPILELHKTHILDNIYKYKGEHSKSGVKYIHWCDISKKWRIRLTVNGKPKLLGYFKTVEDAKKRLEEYWNSLKNEI